MYIWEIKNKNRNHPCFIESGPYGTPGRVSRLVLASHVLLGCWLILPTVLWPSALLNSVWLVGWWAGVCSLQQKDRVCLWARKEIVSSALAQWAAGWAVPLLWLWGAHGLPEAGWRRFCPEAQDWIKCSKGIRGPCVLSIRWVLGPPFPPVNHTSKPKCVFLAFAAWMNHYFLALVLKIHPVAR